MRNGMKKFLLAMVILGGAQSCYGMGNLFKNLFNFSKRSDDRIFPDSLDYQNEIQKVQEDIDRLNNEGSTQKKKIGALKAKQKILKQTIELCKELLTFEKNNKQNLVIQKSGLESTVEWSQKKWTMREPAKYSSVVKELGEATKRIEDFQKKLETATKQLPIVTKELDSATSKLTENKNLLETKIDQKKKMEILAKKEQLDKQINKKTSVALEKQLLKLKKDFEAELKKHEHKRIKKGFLSYQSISLVDAGTKRELSHIVESAVSNFEYCLKNKLNTAPGYNWSILINDFRKRYIKRIGALFGLAKKRQLFAQQQKQSTPLNSPFDKKTLKSDATLLLDLEFGSNVFEQTDAQNNADILKMIQSQERRLVSSEEEIKEEDSLTASYRTCMVPGDVTKNKNP